MIPSAPHTGLNALSTSQSQAALQRAGGTPEEDAIRRRASEEDDGVGGDSNTGGKDRIFGSVTLLSERRVGIGSFRYVFASLYN